MLDVVVLMDWLSLLALLHFPKTPRYGRLLLDFRAVFLGRVISVTLYVSRRFSRDRPAILTGLFLADPNFTPDKNPSRRSLLTNKLETLSIEATCATVIN